MKDKYLMSWESDSVSQNLAGPSVWARSSTAASNKHKLKRKKVDSVSFGLASQTLRDVSFFTSSVFMIAAFLPAPRVSPGSVTLFPSAVI